MNIFHMNVQRLATVWMVAVAFLVVASSPSAAATPEFDFPFTRPSDLTAHPSGAVWLLGARPDSTNSKSKSLYRVTRGFSPRIVQVKGFNRSATTLTALAVGPDGRIWVSARSKKGYRRTTLFRLSTSGKVVRKRTVKSLRAADIAFDNANRLWLLGVSKDGVGFLDRRGTLRRVSTARTRIESITKGPNGSIWAISGDTVLQLRTSGVVGRYRVSGTPTASIAATNNYIWVTGISSVQQIDAKGDVRSISLAFPGMVFPPGAGTPVAYPYNHRMSLSVFPTGPDSIGFTSGTITDSNSGALAGQESTGRVNENGILTEGNPNESLSLDLALNTARPYGPGRDSLLRLATADSSGNLWYASQLGLGEAPSGQW